MKSTLPKYIFSLFLGLIVLSISGQDCTIQYGVDVKNKEKQDSIYSINNEIITESFTPLDSLTLQQIATAYLNCLFTDLEKNNLSLSYDFPRSPILALEILAPKHELSIKQNKENIVVENDTLFYEGKPYITKNGIVDVYHGKQPFLNDSIKEFHNLFRDIAGFQFVEDWAFSNNSFHKEVYSTMPFIEYRKKMNDSLTEKRRKKACIHINASGNPSSPATILIKKDMVYDVFLLPRDLNPRYNSGNYHMNSVHRNKIILDILKATEDSIIKAYPVEYDSVSKTTTLNLERTLSYDEVIKKLSYSFNDTIINHNTIEHIVKFRFYEDWHFSPETFSFTKKVKGIGFILGGKHPAGRCNEYLFMREKVYFKLE